MTPKFNLSEQHSVDCELLCLIGLFYYRQYLTTRLMAWCFHMPKSTIQEYLTHFNNCVFIYSKDWVRLPPRNERGFIIFREKYIVSVFDGCERKVARYEDSREEIQCHSGKKKCSTFNFLMGVDPHYGKPNMISLTYPGSNNDENVVQNPNVK
jgi:hypothetical protein